MPVKDLFHNAVKIGLQKDGWTITQDPLYLKVSTPIEMYSYSFSKLQYQKLS